MPMYDTLSKKTAKYEEKKPNSSNPKGEIKTWPHRRKEKCSIYVVYENYDAEWRFTLRSLILRKHVHCDNVVQS